MNRESYKKYRGKCKEFVDRAVEKDPTLKAVRGHYFCPMWGKQAHWWCVRPDGEIYDSTVDQFPKPHIGDYVEFDGIVVCDECGKEVPETEAIFDGRFGLCYDKCYANG